MNNPRPTQPQPHPSPAGMTVGDIYYVLFRHKWKIIILSILGILAAAVFHYLNSPPYQSQAELMIQYVPDPRMVTLPGNKEVAVADSGAGVINAETTILTSMDLAEEAATNLGPASILADVGGGSNAIAAASVIRGNLLVSPIGNSSVILVSFNHPNPRIVQPVLQEVINDYYEKHKEIHSPGGQYDDDLIREQAAYTLALSDTEKKLADLKNQTKMLSLDDTRKDLSEEISKIKSAMVEAQAGLFVYQAAMKRAGNDSSDKIEITNAPQVIPPDQIDDYNSICADLDGLRKIKQSYSLQGFTGDNALVKEVDGRIDSGLKAKAALEKQYPQIVASGAVSSGGQSPSPAEVLRTQLQRSEDLKATITAWNAQLDQLQIEATNLNNLEPTMEQLELLKGNQQAYLQTLSQSIEKSHIEESLEAGNKAPNIKTVQSPSPPFRDWKKINKTTAMLALGGIFGGLALAFLIELVLDRSVRRPVEIETKLKMPLFLSIPDVARNSHSRVAAIAARRRLQIKDVPAAEPDSPKPDGVPSPEKNGALQLVSLERNPVLQQFSEALRDRLIVYFEVKNLTHKPKLVAVTSAGRGAGVSSIAAGLAASLSETGDGNVLLVDMNLEQGAAQQFYKGKAGCGLDTALQTETKQNAQVQENLYVVNGNIHSAELPRVLPKRFAALVPRLKTSEYDYIIFDMPPVSQTSLTSRLSRFMDMTLLVIESEKTGREVVQQANTWLIESGATVGAVLNKSRQYVPERLHQEFLSDK